MILDKEAKPRRHFMVGRFRNTTLYLGERLKDFHMICQALFGIVMGEIMNELHESDG